MKQRWIPISERLPENGVQVLCCNKYGSVFTSCVTAKDRSSVYFGKHYDVIAWMPLPEPYQVGAENAHTEKPQTNADRIRSMTDEELAEVLFGSCIERMGVEECFYPVGALKGIPDCKTCISDWLKAESEG